MNITRTINLFRSYFIENKKRLLLSSLAIFTGLALGFTLSGEPEILVLVPYLVMIVLASKFFQSSLKRSNGTHFFNLPVTSFEKLINAIVIFTILGIVFIGLALAGACVGHYLILPLLFPNETMTLRFDIWSLCIVDYNALLHFIAFLSAFLFGSIYFRNNAFWKTVLSGIVVLLGFSIYAIALLAIAFRGERGNYLNIGDQEYDIIISPFFQNYYYLIPIAIIIFVLSLTYLRLRETEV